MITAEAHAAHCRMTNATINNIQEAIGTTKGASYETLYHERPPNLLARNECKKVIIFPLCGDPAVTHARVTQFIAHTG